MEERIVDDNPYARTAILFVHGLFSSSRTWSRILALLAEDPQFEPLSVLTFDYSSPIIRFSRLRRIPEYNVLADNLGTFLEVDLADYENLVIVTHSQGGLIVQRYLSRMLSAGRGEELARIRRIVFFACPNSGAEIFLLLRKFGRFWNHAQERELRPLNDAVLEAQRTVLNRVVHARGVTRDECKIDILAYAGETDNVVTPASARGVFPRCGVVPGDHFSIIQPDSHSHRTYTTLRAAIVSLRVGVGTPAPGGESGGEGIVVSTDASALIKTTGIRSAAAGDAICLSFSSAALTSVELRVTRHDWVEEGRPSRLSLERYLAQASGCDADALLQLRDALPIDRDHEHGEVKLNLLNLVRASPEHGQALSADLRTAPWWVEREFNRALLRRKGLPLDTIRLRLLRELLTTENDAGTHSFRFPSSLYVEMAIVDESGCVLALEKDAAQGSHMAQGGRRWTASIEEGAKYDDMVNGSLDPYRVVRRGLQEELGLGDSEVSGVEFRAFAISCSNLNTALVGVIRINASVRDLASRASRREFRDFVRGQCLEPSDVDSLLSGKASEDHAPPREWHSTAHLRLLLTTLAPTALT